MHQVETYTQRARSWVALYIDLFVILTFRDHDARVAAAGVWRWTAPGRWERQQTLAVDSMSGNWHQVMRPSPAHRFSSSGQEWHHPIT